jgi:hypothetical protein
VGKTTIAISLAEVYARSGQRVIHRCRPQGSVLARAAARKADLLFTVASIAKHALHKELPTSVQQNSSQIGLVFRRKSSIAV